MNDTTTILRDERITQILNYLYQLASKDFSKEILPCGNGDELDAIIMGLRIVSEELSSSIHEKDDALAESRRLNHRLNSILNTLPIVVYSGYFTDEEIKLEFVSISIERLTGHSADKFLYEKNFWFSIIHPDDLPALLQSRAALQQSGEMQNEFRYTAFDGSTRWMSDIIHLIASEPGELPHFIGTAYDITERVQTEEGLRTFTANLEKVVQERTAQIESAVKSKGEFLTHISHEIRTPISGIISMIELLLETNLSDPQLRYMHLMKRSSETLLALINDILDYSSIERGKLQLRPKNISLRATVAEILKTISVRAAEKKLELLYVVDSGVPDAVLIDANRLGQIFLNLVGNAIKFTERGEIVVRIREWERLQKKTLLHFSVSDTGSGISPEKREKIFDAFYQIDHPSSLQQKGTGLGLAITKQLIRLMGGTLWVESALGKGSSFHFTLLAEITSDAEPFIAPPDLLQGKTALIADDNPTTRVLFIEVLENFGMLPDAVSTGDAVLARLLSAAESGNPYPLLLLDIEMPVMDGFMVAERIQEDERLNNTQVIIISTSQKQSDRDRFERIGIRNFFSKPFSYHELFETIQRCMRAYYRSEEIAVHERVEQFTKVAPAHPVLTRLDILLAEDNKINQQVLKAILEKDAHQVTIAANGFEALAYIERERFDIVLMDIEMPEMDGIQTTKRIREKEAQLGGHLPIIALTAHHGADLDDYFRSHGMDGFLSKPIRTVALYKLIKEVLHREAMPAHTRTEPQEGARFFDRAVAMEFCEGDETLLRAMVASFLKNSSAMVERIVAAGRDDDRVQLGKTLHQLKGSVGYFGAKEFNQVVENMELKVNALEHKEMEELMQRLLVSFEGLRQELEDYFQSHEVMKIDQF